MWDIITTAGLGVLQHENSKSNQRQQAAYNQTARQDQRYYFDQTMDNSIQRRAADARKAGISPLAAMGSAPSSMPNIQTGRVSNQNPLTGIADMLAYMIQADHSKDLLEKEIQLMKLRDADRNQRLGYKPGNPLEITEIEQEQQERPRVDSRGNNATPYPVGSPAEKDEKEFGEWGNLLQTRRFVNFLGELSKDEFKYLIKRGLKYHALFMNALQGKKARTSDTLLNKWYRYLAR